MKTVLASGVFDILHPGHLYFLREAAKLGDRLVVAVASDGHAADTKRQPVHPAADRAKLVGALQFVDAAFVAAEPYDLVATVRTANPDIIALGHDQEYGETELRQLLADASIHVDVVRISKQPGSTLSTRDWRPAA